MSKISKKILLVGHFHVGKSSLIRRFVNNAFSEDYITSIGVTIEKKEIHINGTDLTMIIWDIAGEVSIKKTPKSYLLGLHGLIYVFDFTRDSTWINLEEQINEIKKMFPFTPCLVVGNKIDLIGSRTADKVCQQIPVDVDFRSSAKTGENVEEIFEKLGTALL